MESISLVEDSIPGVAKKVSQFKNKYVFEYPCQSYSNCTDYKVILQPGAYKFELYGASGGSYVDSSSSFRYENNTCLDETTVQRYGGNTNCLKVPSIGGAGGYISGIIQLNSKTDTFLTVGGKGNYSYNFLEYNTPRCYEKDNMVKGGYGGGGSSANYCSSPTANSCGTGSGGGQTAVKFVHNDLWHRVLVSGGGGGTDDKSSDDGSGGSGGNLIAQSWFKNGNLQNQYYADSLQGFTFGTGEAARYGSRKNENSVDGGQPCDAAGAGGGWFGGFASQDPSSGAGGGSSWALSEDTEIPQGLISARDEFFENEISKEYAFTKNSGYLFTDVINIGGIWSGNGRIIITVLDFYKCPTFFISYPLQINFLFVSLLLEINTT